MMSGPGSFWRFFFRGPPPRPACFGFPPPERLASTPGGREQRIGVVGSPCPMLRWTGCARRSQEPRPGALRYKRQGQLPLGAFWFREVLD